tara:strand:- start:1456 stop:1863 length:408 start_codon:yes stop_codon:yes gene_type:complete
MVSSLKKLNIWPDFFPSDVPPSASEPTSGISFRLVDNDPPIRKDFESTYEENPSRLKVDSSQLDRDCCYGTSQFKDINDIRKKKRLFPKLRAKLIAVGELEPSMGKMMDTYKPSHHTIWYFSSAQPQLYFTVTEK